MNSAVRHVRFNLHGNSLTKRVFDVIAQFPEGIAAHEIKDLLPEDNVGNAIFGTISALKMGGKILTAAKRKNPVTDHWVAAYTINENWNAGAPIMRKPAPAPIGIQANLDAAKATIAELQAWKAAAIARYPDLAVEPALLEARKRAAAVFKTDGDHLKATAIMAGKHDSTAIVRALFDAITEMQP